MCFFVVYILKWYFKKQKKPQKQTVLNISKWVCSPFTRLFSALLLCAPKLQLLHQHTTPHPLYFFLNLLFLAKFGQFFFINF